MVNYLELSPNLVTGGSPNRQDLQHLSSNGCEVVINLALPTSPDSISDEGDEVTRMGMRYISIPVVWEAPNRQDLLRFFTALDEHQDRKVFVHCVKNMRVSAFIYLYRVLRLGWDETNARPDLLKIWEPSGTWLTFIEQMLSEKPPAP